MTLTEFLLARIAEDAWVAEAADMTRHFGDPGESVRKVQEVCAVEEIAHTIRHNPARVLADCESKRRIVEYADSVIAESERLVDYDVPAHDAALTGDRILELLALPYADHPDYDEAWRPD